MPVCRGPGTGEGDVEGRPGRAAVAREAEGRRDDRWPAASNGVRRGRFSRAGGGRGGPPAAGGIRRMRSSPMRIPCARARAWIGVAAEHDNRVRDDRPGRRADAAVVPRDGDRDAPAGDHRIKVFLALPLKGWNGRFQGTGGGGFSGGSPSVAAPAADRRLRCRLDGHRTRGRSRQLRARRERADRLASDQATTRISASTR